MKKVSLLIFCLLLAGCGASKPVPDWLNASYNQLESYKKNFLSGREKIAAVQFKGVLIEIKKSGDLELLARTHLIRMALQTAVLEDMEEGEYLKINDVGPSLQNHSFHAFLKGEASQVDENLLPGQYHGFYRTMKRDAGAADCLQEIGKMEDPLPQLVALGVLVRLRHYDESVLKKAVDISSAQGWKKALLAYLERLQNYYEEKKEPANALGIQQRIKIIKD